MITGFAVSELARKKVRGFISRPVTNFRASARTIFTSMGLEVATCRSMCSISDSIVCSSARRLGEWPASAMARVIRLALPCSSR